MENDIQNPNIGGETHEDISVGAVSEQERELRRKKARRFNRVLYCISAALILTGVFIILRSETTLFTKNSTGDPVATFPPDDIIVMDGAPTPQSTAAPTQAAEDPSAQPPDYPPPTEAPQPLAPVAIHFVGHDVSCSVQPVGLTDDGVMDTVPSHNIVGWYMYGAAPNEHGNCIIAGHNRYHGQMGSFSLLHNGLAVGDRITVDLEDGSSRFYRVATLNTYLYSEVPGAVMALGGTDRLTLITCLGDFDYDLQMSRSRVIAVCIPVE